MTEAKKPRKPSAKPIKDTTPAEPVEASPESTPIGDAVEQEVQDANQKADDPNSSIRSDVANLATHPEDDDPLSLVGDVVEEENR